MLIEARRPAPKTPLGPSTGVATAGRTLIDELRAQRGAIVVKRTIDGRDYFIKRLSWPELTRVKLAMPRNISGQLDLSREDHLRGITAAMLAVALVVLPEGKTLEALSQDELNALPPMFTVGECVEFVDEPEAVELNAKLFDAITEVNPRILPN